jgi:hypothetical protein
VGYTNQVSTDFSRAVIETMRERYRDLDLNWEVMGVRKMHLGDGSFDLAIDKVSETALYFRGKCADASWGTLDVMLHGSLGDPEDDVKANVRGYVKYVPLSTYYY